MISDFTPVIFRFHLWFQDFTCDFRISSGFQDFTRDFMISSVISGFHPRFQDFRESSAISEFHLRFQDFTCDLGSRFWIKWIMSWSRLSRPNLSLYIQLWSYCKLCKSFSESWLPRPFPPIAPNTLSTLFTTFYIDAFRANVNMWIIETGDNGRVVLLCCCLFTKATQSCKVGVAKWA